MYVCVLTDAGAPVEQVGAIVMETTSAFTVVPAGQVDTAGVVVALDQALCTLVDICGHRHTRGRRYFPGDLKLQLICVFFSLRSLICAVCNSRS